MSENPTRIVVGVDGSDHSIKAVRAGADLAKALGLSLHAIAAWQWPIAGSEFAAAVTWNPEEDALTILKEVTGTVFGDAVPDWFTSEAVKGSAAQTLIDASENARFVVVGSRGHGGFAGMLLGSVSNAVAAHAKCNVLVVH